VDFLEAPFLMWSIGGNNERKITEAFGSQKSRCTYKSRGRRARLPNSADVTPVRNTSATTTVGTSALHSNINKLKSSNFP
jgi:hypothetical protein